MRILLFVVLSISYGLPVAYAIDFFEVESEVLTKDPRKSHFHFLINASVYQFEPAYDFNAQKFNFSERSVNALGSDLLFGWKQNILAGLSLSAHIGGFFQRYTKDNKTKASPDLPEVISSFDEQVNLFGAYAGGELGYLFNFKIAGVQLEPFVAAYAGRGKSSTKIDYSYDLSPVTESYKAEIDEDFNFTRSGFGFNFVSNQSWFARIAVFQVNQTLVERTSSGTKTGVAFSSSVSSGESQSFNIYSLGFGYQI
jgi:hypothetical protein